MLSQDTFKCSLFNNRRLPRLFTSRTTSNNSHTWLQLATMTTWLWGMLRGEKGHIRSKRSNRAGKKTAEASLEWKQKWWISNASLQFLPIIAQDEKKLDCIEFGCSTSVSSNNYRHARMVNFQLDWVLTQDFVPHLRCNPLAAHCSPWFSLRRVLQRVQSLTTQRPAAPQSLIRGLFQQQQQRKVSLR